MGWLTIEVLTGVQKWQRTMVWCRGRRSQFTMQQINDSASYLLIMQTLDIEIDITVLLDNWLINQVISIVDSEHCWTLGQ